MKATFENTVDILVKAYLNDTLQHCNCYACAIGNIVAGNLGIGYVVGDIDDHDNVKFGPKWDAPIKPCWQKCFGTLTDGRSYFRGLDSLMEGDQIRHEIHATGYSLNELQRIERAFEVSDKGKDEEEWMFNGLMAVVDVLAEIHNIDLKTKSEAKAMFVKETI